MAFSIYIATDPEGRHYVGCTSKPVMRRWRQQERGFRDWPAERFLGICDGIARYGHDGFTVRVLATVEDIEDAKAIETLMIERHGSLRPNGYNAMKTSSYTRRSHWKAA
jgi:hypothetical protein